MADGPVPARQLIHGGAGWRALAKDGLLFADIAGGLPLDRDRRDQLAHEQDGPDRYLRAGALAGRQTCWSVVDQFEELFRYRSRAGRRAGRVARKRDVRQPAAGRDAQQAGTRSTSS